MKISFLFKLLVRVGSLFLLMGTFAQAAAPGAGPAPMARATFAGGCFWCMEPPYDELEGVRSTVSGYIGGVKKNPTYEEVSAGARFCDAGSQYRCAIFYHDGAQKTLAETSRKRVQSRFKQPIVTEIIGATEFYPAEDYHQDYYKKNPIRYKPYRYGCGRDRRLRELWGDKKS